MNQLPPFFSIIVPCYNGEDYIEETIQSALAQTFSSFEIIIVNDGSTDGSAQLLEQLAPTDQRIKVITQTNGGLSNARNTAVNNSRGEWVVLLDADDLYDKERLTRLAAVIEQHPNEDFLFHDASRIDEKSGLVDRSHIHRGQFYADLRKMFRSGSDSVLDAREFSQFILSCYTVLLPITLCVSSRLIKMLGDKPFDEGLKVGEDVDFCVRGLNQTKNAIYMDEILAHYRLHQSSMTKEEGYKLKLVEYYARMKLKYLADLDPAYKQLFLAKYSEHCLDLNYSMRQQERFWSAFKLGLKAFLLTPSLDTFIALPKSIVPTRNS